MGSDNIFFGIPILPKTNSPRPGFPVVPFADYGRTVVQILPKTPYQHNFSHELLISAELAPNDVGRCCADCSLGGGSA